VEIVLNGRLTGQLVVMDMADLERATH